MNNPPTLLLDSNKNISGLLIEKKAD